jgi:hypothetical protein
LPGVGVGGGGVPPQTLIASKLAKLFDVLELLEPPPQLIISAAAKNDSTGASTRHLRRQIMSIEP